MQALLDVGVQLLKLLQTVYIASFPFCAVQVPGYVVQRLQRVRDAGSNQVERKRRARLLALLAALIRVSTISTSLSLHSNFPAA